VKEALQKQLEGAQADLEAAAGQLAESRKKGEALAAQLATAEEAKGLAEKVGAVRRICVTNFLCCSLAGMVVSSHLIAVEQLLLCHGSSSACQIV
jgi:hypothetical protein